MKDRFGLSFLASLLLHTLFFAALYFAGFNAKEQIRAANEPIFMSLADSEKEPQKDPQPPKKQEPQKQKQTKQKPVAKPPVQPLPKPSPETFANEKIALPQQAEAKSEPQQKPSPPSPPRTDDKNNEIKKYLSKVRKKLQDNLEYPHFAKKAGMQGVATVHFCIHADGSIEPKSLGVLKSSGHALLDTQALETVRNSVPFTPPPQGEIEVSISVSFSLT